MEEIIVSYIFEHKNIKYHDLNYALTKTKKYMTPKTLKYYLYSEDNPDNLIKKGHVIAHKTRMYNNKEYPDVFEVNEKAINLYSTPKKITQIRIAKKLETLMKETTKVSTEQLALVLDYLMDFGIKTEIIQETTSKKIFFSNTSFERFITFLELMVYECFINNPDTWYIFEEKEDLDFSINIKLEFSKIPFLFDYFYLLREVFLHNKNRYENIFMRKYCSLIKNKKEHSKLEYDNLEIMYAKAKFEHEIRNGKTDKRLEDWVAHLENPTKEYFSDKYQNKEKRFQFEIERNINNILNKNYEFIVAQFEAFGQTKKDPNYFSKIQEKLKKEKK